MFLPIALSVHVGCAPAQPNLTRSVLQPAVGQVHDDLGGPVLAPWTSGPNRVCGFTSASTAAGPSFTFVVPATAPGAADFPSATACSNSGMAFTCQRYVNQGAYEPGTAMPGLGRTVYTDPMQFLKFPLTYNTSWDDSYQGDLDFSGNTGTPTGTLSATADGYGTLQLPRGNVLNVLHLRVTQGETVVVAGATTTVQRLFPYFLKAGVGVPVAQRVAGPITGPGGTQADQTFHDLNEAPMAVDMAEAAGGLPVRAAPVPADERVTVALSDAVLTDVQARDIAGRAVPAHRAGVRQAVIDASAWPPGLCVLRILVADGRSAARIIAVR